MPDEQLELLERQRAEIAALQERAASAENREVKLLEALETTVAELNELRRRALNQVAEPLSRSTGLQMAKSIAKGYGVTTSAILGTTRKGHVQAARVALYRTLRDLGWSSVKIGELVHRDHTTVLAALQPEETKRRKARLRKEWANRQ
jgi:chromosomal replication initiation ATPase DnaA